MTSETTAKRKAKRRLHSRPVSLKGRARRRGLALEAEPGALFQAARGVSLQVVVIEVELFVWFAERPS